MKANLSVRLWIFRVHFLPFKVMLDVRKKL